MNKKAVLILVVFMVVCGAHAESFSQQVMAQIQPMMQINWPDTELNFGELTIGINETEVMPLQILANVGYTVELQASSINLREYISEQGAYGKQKLGQPLKITVDNGVTWSDLQNSLILIDRPEGSQKEEVFKLKYRQVMSFPEDKALKAGSVYKTDITLLITPLI